MAELARRRSRYGAYRHVPDRLAYDGSAARRLEREEVLQPRPLVRPRERVVARPKVRVREAGKVSVFAVVGFLAVGVFAVVLLMSYVQLATLSDDVVGLRSQMTDLQAEEAKLRVQYELAYDLGTIEQSVTAAGQMVKPQADQVFYVDLAEPDSVVRFDQETPTGGLRGAVESFQAICGEIVEYFR